MRNKHMALQLVQEKFPEAMFARFVDECHCDMGKQIFWFVTPQSPDDEGFLSGGWYCPVCEFSNAGKCHIMKLL